MSWNLGNAVVLIRCLLQFVCELLLTNPFLLFTVVKLIFTITNLNL